MRKPAAPIPLGAEIDTSTFRCGESTLDLWLQKHAMKNETEGASRTYVSCAGNHIAGFYSLAAGAITHRVAIGRVRRNMPDPIPALVLGRLAVDREWQHHGLGASLLMDALLRCLGAAETIGARVILVHALSESTKRFYQRFGFRESPVNKLTLMLPIKDIQTTFALRTSSSDPC